MLETQGTVKVLIRTLTSQENTRASSEPLNFDKNAIFCTS